MPKQLHLFLLGLIFILGICLRFYQLENLPADLFGDVLENIRHTRLVLEGEYKVVYGFDVRESMLYYLTALSSHFFGNNYFNLKIVTATLGSITILAVYLLAKEITSNTWVALLSAFVYTTAFHSLVYARMGFRNILTPLFVCLSLQLVLRALRQDKLISSLVAGLIMALGLYTYPAFYFTLMCYVVLMASQLIARSGKRKRVLIHLLLTTVVLGIGATPLIKTYFKDPSYFVQHTKPMVVREKEPVRADWLAQIGLNMLAHLKWFHLEGDRVFRVNPERKPLLDPISGVLIVIGLLSIIHRKKRAEWLVIILPLLVFQLPSILVITNEGDTPSNTRSIAALPFVYIAISMGIWKIYQIVKSINPSTFPFALGIVSLLLLSIANLNIDTYFDTYAYNLPNHNIAPAIEIAKLVKKHPQPVIPHMVGCCWNDHGQPTPKAFKQGFAELDLAIETVQEDVFMNCQSLFSPPKQLVIFSDEFKSEIEACAPGMPIKSHISGYGQVLFYSLDLTNWVEAL